jgi:hypothetical protein
LRYDAGQKVGRRDEPAAGGDGRMAPEGAEPANGPIAADAAQADLRR